MELEDRLINWGIVMRSRMRANQAGSAEGAYRSPQRGHWEPAGLTPSGARADPKDAAEIESAVCLLPLTYHAILRAWYVYRSPMPVLCRLCRKLGFRLPDATDADAAVGMAKAMLAGTLEIPTVLRRLRIKALVEREIAYSS